MRILEWLLGLTKKASGGSHPPVDEVFAKLDGLRRPASVARIGGFRPPDDPLTSWFGGRCVALPDEPIPEFEGERMFPLLQVNCSELPFVPHELQGTALFVVWMSRSELPLERPHGEGWIIREYRSVDGLELVTGAPPPSHVRSFPIRWELREDNGPGWEEAWELVDLTSVNESEGATHEFFERYESWPGTKIGGYPAEIQHRVGGDGPFVFQIGSEEKPNWMWVDNGIGYFRKSADGEWELYCQFY